MKAPTPIDLSPEAVDHLKQTIRVLLASTSEIERIPLVKLRELSPTLALSS